jgi:membrane protease subunit HflC
VTPERGSQEHSDAKARRSHVIRRKYYTAAIVLIVLLALRTTAFVVDETKIAIVTQLGRPVRVVKEAGLNWKLPQPIQAVRLFDKRLLVYDPKPTEFLTNDKKNVVVDAFVVWRISDAGKFLETVSDRDGAEVRMADIIASELGAALGQYPLHALISTNEDSMKVGRIMEGVAANCRTTASASFGIEVADVRMKRLAFPEQNKQSVFDRMRAERERTAKKYRSEGEEEAIKIRAEADKERQEILAEAYKQAEQIRGEGDAEAMRIYGAAYSTDPSFYEFTRTLESYRKFLDEKTTIVLSSESDLLELFDKQGD